MREETGENVLVEASFSGVAARPLGERIRRSSANQICVRRLQVAHPRLLPTDLPRGVTTRLVAFVGAFAMVSVSVPGRCRAFLLDVLDAKCVETHKKGNILYEQRCLREAPFLWCAICPWPLGLSAIGGIECMLRRCVLSKAHRPRCGS